MRYQPGDYTASRKGPNLIWEVSGALAVVLFVGVWLLVPRTEPAPEPPPQPVVLADELVAPQELITILIDPGHGGKDPGATGPTGLMEKDVALDVSGRLAQWLRAQGLDVKMTRTGDEAVALNRRAAMAQELGADLLVSVHVNALPKSVRPFVETYYFRPRRQHHRYRVHYTPAEWEARNRIADQSEQLAGHVQKAVLAQVRQHNATALDNGVRRRGFRVLRSVSAPAVLAELTVLTVPEEEARLRSDAYRDQLAHALGSGVMAYLQTRSEIAGEAAAIDSGLEHAMTGP